MTMTLIANLSYPNLTRLLYILTSIWVHCTLNVGRNFILFNNLNTELWYGYLNAFKWLISFPKNVLTTHFGTDSPSPTF